LQNKSVKELQEIVIEKDSCLDALNLQLSALLRRESTKESTGKESAPYSFATTSTEYRTLNEDFNLKILDIENELHERAACIDQLQTQLTESLQERSRLNEEISELKMKIAGIESLKSSEDEHTMISASRINEFKKSLNDEEAVCFSKVWTKFEMFHKNELDQLKMNHDMEMKNLEDMMKNDKREADIEVNRLRQLLNSVKSDSPVIDDLRRELENKHAKEMEKLREYFEKRCVDMEKQYSEEVFSQHSRKAEESGNESDNETLPDDEMQIPLESPRKIARMEAMSGESEGGEKPGYRNVEELESYYLDRIDELQKYNDEVVKKLKLKLQHYESNFDNGKGFSVSKFLIINFILGV
jgi:golgin subfamily B member 1